jgi:hypothetical protein
MKKVIIYKIETPSMESKPIVEVFLSDANIITFTGNETIIENLTNIGIPDRNSEKNLFPSDGMTFLTGLQYAYRTPYMSATEPLEI